MTVGNLISLTVGVVMSKKSAENSKVAVDSSRRKSLKNAGKAAAVAPAAGLLLASGSVNAQQADPYQQVLVTPQL